MIKNSLNSDNMITNKLKIKTDLTQYQAIHDR